jgi:hypothetical protein
VIIEHVEITHQELYLADPVVFTVGAEPGVPLEPNYWETNRDYLPRFEPGRFEEARSVLTAALAEFRDQSGLLYICPALMRTYVR